jgi:hypothetical protein
VESRDARRTDAGLVAQLGFDAREQFIRNLCTLTPAGAFVRVGRAETALVRLAAERTLLRVTEGCPLRWAGRAG